MKVARCRIAMVLWTYVVYCFYHIYEIMIKSLFIILGYKWVHFEIWSYKVLKKNQLKQF